MTKVRIEWRLQWVAALALLGVNATVSAHHSTAAYDYSKSLMLSGTVTDFQWTNPHMFIHLHVLDASGNEAEWNVECGTPNINVRHGWKKSDINRGDKLVMEIHPMRDGSLSGTLMTVTLADGRLLYGPGNDIKGGGPPGAPPGQSGAGQGPPSDASEPGPRP